MTETHQTEQILPIESLCEPTKFKRFTEQYNGFTSELKYLNELDDIFLTLKTDTAQIMEEFFSKLKTGTKVKIPFPADRLAELTKNSKYCSLRLKVLNRKAHLDKAADKENILEAREKVNQANFDLQNLLHEKGHLRREIEKCRENRFTFKDILLMNEEFAARTPGHSSTLVVNSKMGIDDNNQDDSFEKISSHHLTIQRFKNEMIECQRLEAERDEKRRKKLLLTQELAEKQAKTVETRREIEKFLVASSILRSFIVTQPENDD
ncbi:4873_t:CDS:2 [Ambispora leptoticha]|uniref:4873_t:CDS:1 n=1 Tax=Ambispora leptoticha TaxID=144679 RepID=A0A9N8YZQ2_9GLOM|nr:4873_t:CDS:2 [Ambispora leptoticha]